eukprot:1692013-Pyramimonas_sp.AAC.1
MAKISDPRSEDGGSSLLGGSAGSRTAARAIYHRSRSAPEPRASNPRTSSPSLLTLGSRAR